MATQDSRNPATLEDVISRIKAEGQLSRNTGAHSIKSVKDYIHDGSKLIFNANMMTYKSLNELVDVIRGDALKNIEVLREKKQEDEKKYDLLEKMSGSLKEVQKNTKKSANHEDSLPFLILAGVTAILAPIKKIVSTIGKILTSPLKPFVIVFDQIKLIVKDLARGLVWLKDHKFMKGIQTGIKFVFSKMKYFIDLIRLGIGVYFPRLDKALMSIENFIKGIGNFFKGIQTFGVKIINFIPNVIKNMQKSNSMIIRTFGWISKGILELTKGLAWVGKWIGTGAFKSIVSIFSKVAAFIRTITIPGIKFLGLFGRILAPIQAMIIVWETVTGAIEGFQKGGWMGAIEGAIQGFVGAFMVIPDAIKNGIAWILEKFGADQIAEKLRSFSFEESVSMLISKIFSLGRGIFSWFASQLGFDAYEGSKLQESVNRVFGDKINFVSDFISGIAEKLTAIFKDSLKALLPDQDSFFGKIVPDWIYKAVGLNPVDMPEINKADVASIGQVASNVIVDESAEMKSKQRHPRFGGGNVVAPSSVTTNNVDNRSSGIIVKNHGMPDETVRPSIMLGTRQTYLRGAR